MISVRNEAGLEETISLDEFEARIRQGVIAPSTSVRFPVLTGERWVDARDLEVFQRLYAPARLHFSRAFSLGRVPVLTILLIAIQAVIFFGIAGSERALPLDPLIRAGAKIQANIVELGETWRLLTANLLHRDVLHLLFNMFFLFNVGGTIENAYRLQDYALILTFSAITTTSLSTAMSPMPSVGASGMVLGLFGSASVFGHKYGEILPERYRRYFGGAVLPYAIFILYVGLATQDTDNWGHLGGFIGGLAITTLLNPRLLHLGRPPGSFAGRNWPALATLGLVGAVFGAGPVMRALGPSLRQLRDEQSGISVEYPAAWPHGENHVGYPSFGNALGASLGLRANWRPDRPTKLQEIKKTFLEEELRSREQTGDIAQVHVLDERPVLLHGGRAIELTITLESRAGPQRTWNILVERGYYSYAIVLSSPEGWADEYAAVFEKLEREIRLIEPATLVKSRSLVATFPGMSSAHVELGRQLAEIGEVEAAAQSYQRALQTVPEHPDALYGLAKLAADYDGDLDGAVEIAASLHQQKPEEPTYALLAADLRQRLGQVEAACSVLQDTLDRVSDPPEDLRERLRVLRCSYAGPLDR